MPTIIVDPRVPISGTLPWSKKQRIQATGHSISEWIEKAVDMRFEAEAKANKEKKP